MAKSPSEYRDQILSWDIYCNDKKVNDSFRLSSASIRIGLNRIGKATLKFDAGDTNGKFDETDSDMFKPGKKIRIDMGTSNNKQTLFSGIIISLKLEIVNQEHPQMDVECRDNAFHATLSRRNNVFEKQKDSEILKSMLKEYGNVSVDSTGETYPSLVQYYCTDWDFALSRANANGLFILSHKGNIAIKKPAINASPVLTVTYGKDLIDFDGTISSGDQYTTTEAIAWNPQQQNTTSATASPPPVNPQGDLSLSALKEGDKYLIQTDTNLSASALKSWTDGQALKAALARYQGSIEFYGSPEVVPGCIIELAGLGKRFNGNAFIGWVEHTIENNEWITRAGMGVDSANITEEPDVTAPPASGWVPGIQGIHIGTVKQINEDTEKEFRVLVELPWLHGKKKMLWARLGTPYSGNKTGFFFYPEVNTEVIIGFINNDPACPVILGSLYNPKMQPPYALDGKNNTKAIVTREKMIIEFDEEKKVITLTTPAKNQVVIDDGNKHIKLSDQHKNEILMDKEGIHLSSSKNIQLKAKGSILLDAVNKAEIKAKNDVAVEGLNVKISAKIGATVKGTATAELSASGQTTVKGAMVMIN